MVSASPDVDLIKQNYEIIEKNRSMLYKYYCKMERCILFYYPHKFTESVNSKIGYSKVVLNPKFYSGISDIQETMETIFGVNYDFQKTKVNKIELACDTPDIDMSIILSIMTVRNSNYERFSIYKGTIYNGENPRLKIYDKNKEILFRKGKGLPVTEQEEKMLASGLNYTRFEISIKNFSWSMKELKKDYSELVYIFDRIQFFDITGYTLLQSAISNFSRPAKEKIKSLENNKLFFDAKENFKNDCEIFFSN